MLLVCGAVLISHPSCNAFVFCQTRGLRSALVRALSGRLALRYPGLAMHGTRIAGAGSKHTNIRYFFAVDKLEKKEIKIEYSIFKSIDQ